MREQVRVVLTVARDRTLARIELAYLGFIMAEYGTWMALIVYAYDLGGATTAGLFALVQLLPAGIVAPFASAWGDRFRQDRVLLAAYIWQGVSLGAAAVAMYAGAPPGVILALATVAAISFTVPRPVQSAILPNITHTPGDLTAANAVSGFAENFGIFTGPLVGGILLALRSEPADVFATFAAVALLAALLAAGLPRLQGQLHESPGGLRAVLGSSFGGFGALAASPRILLLVLVLSAATVVVGALDILYVAAAVDLLGEGEEWAGYLFAAFGLGGVLGALASVALVGRRRMTPALAVSGGLFGIAIATIPLVPATVTAPLLFAASGAGYSVASVAGRTLIQRTAPESLLARVFGVLEGLTMFSFALGALGIAVLISAFGVGWAAAIAGLSVPAILVLAWLKLGALDRDAKVPDPEAVAILRHLAIFTPLSATTMERILVELTWLDVPAGHVLIRQGERGDLFYVLAEGRVQIVRDGNVIAEREAVDYIGEIALLRDVPRTATVIAVRPSRLMVIEGDRFLSAVTGHAQSRTQAEAVAAGRE